MCKKIKAVFQPNSVLKKVQPFHGIYNITVNLSLANLLCIQKEKEKLCT